MPDTRQPEPTIQSAVERMMPSIVTEMEDAQHGRVRCVVVTPEKVYLRMVLEENKEKKALRFVAPIPVGTKVKILKGGSDERREDRKRNDRKKD